MTVKDWMDKVRMNQDALRELIYNYHPSSRKPNRAALPITAELTEAVCVSARKAIKQRHPDNPVTQFDLAVQANDTRKLMSLLDGAWFGVPESTSCWGIAGFPEAVDLMDDPPDQEE